MVGGWGGGFLCKQSIRGEYLLGGDGREYLQKYQIFSEGLTQMKMKNIILGYINWNVSRQTIYKASRVKGQCQWCVKKAELSGDEFGLETNTSLNHNSWGPGAAVRIILNIFHEISIIFIVNIFRSTSFVCQFCDTHITFPISPLWQKIQQNTSRRKQKMR